MELVKEELMVPKESHDVVKLVVELIKALKDGAQMEDAKVLWEHGGPAFKGIAELDDEFKSKYRGDITAHLSKQLHDVIF